MLFPKWNFFLLYRPPSPVFAKESCLTDYPRFSPLLLSKKRRGEFEKTWKSGGGGKKMWWVHEYTCFCVSGFRPLLLLSSGQGIQKLALNTWKHFLRGTVCRAKGGIFRLLNRHERPVVAQIHLFPPPLPDLPKTADKLLDKPSGDIFATLFINK